MAGNQRLMLGLFVALAALLALAPGKLPIFAVSATAPLLVWIVIEAAMTDALRVPFRWLVLAGLFWSALFCSLAANAVLGELGSIEDQSLLLLTRYGFWLLAFVTTAGVTAKARWTPRLVEWMAVIAVGLALMRIANAALGGGDWLQQNEYGLRFSAFTPFLLAACVGTRGSVGCVAALAITAAALLGNGSRSCWIALAIAAIALLLAHVAAGRSVRGPVLALTVAPMLLATVAWMGSADWSRAVRSRWESLAHLSTDKPFQTRLAMIEKGVRLFEERPVFGAGLGRFHRERVKLAAARTPWTNDAELNQRSSHNSYVSLLAETGLAGILTFTALLAFVLVGGGRAAIRLARSGEEWALGVWASALAVSIHLWALAGLTGTLPWFIFGLAAGVIERDRNRRFA